MYQNYSTLDRNGAARRHTDSNPEAVNVFLPVLRWKEAVDVGSCSCHRAESPPTHHASHRLKTRIPCSVQMLVVRTCAIAVGQSNRWLDSRDRVEASCTASLPPATPQAPLSKAGAPFLGLKTKPKANPTAPKTKRRNQELLTPSKLSDCLSHMRNAFHLVTTTKRASDAITSQVP